MNRGVESTIKHVKETVTRPENVGLASYFFALIGLTIGLLVAPEAAAVAGLAGLGGMYYSARKMDQQIVRSPSK